MPVCPGCGNMVSEDAATCSNCGSIIKEIGTIYHDAGSLGSTRLRSMPGTGFEQPVTPVKREPSNLNRASLTIVKGANKDTEFLLSSDRVRIGRERTENDIVLDDSQASRCHAVITFENRQYTLTDLQSTNGTQVNGQTITRYDLTDGDVIRIGDTFLAFYL